MYKNQPDPLQNLREILNPDQNDDQKKRLKNAIFEGIQHIPTPSEILDLTSYRLKQIISTNDDPAAKNRLLQLMIRKNLLRQITIASILKNSQNYQLVETQLKTANIQFTSKHIVNISFCETDDLQQAIDSGIFNLCEPQNYKLLIPGYNIHKNIQQHLIASSHQQSISLDGFLNLSHLQIDKLPKELHLHGTIYLDQSTITQMPQKITLHASAKIICPGAFFPEFPNQTLTQIFQNNPEKYQQTHQNIVEDVNYYSGNY